MTAAVLPYQSSLPMSMSLFGTGDNRSDGYYQPNNLSQSSGLPHSYLEQKQHPTQYPPTSRHDGTFLHPRNSLPPLQPTSNYSSPTVIVPPASHQRHQYGPISNSVLQTTPTSLSYMDHGPGAAYTNAQYSGAAYSIAGS